MMPSLPRVAADCAGNTAWVPGMSWRRAWRALWGILLLCAAWSGVLWSPPALAHAALVSSSPANGALLEVAPLRVALVFDEPVAPLVLRLLTPAGEALPLGAVQQQGKALSVDLPPLAVSGTYTLSWRVVSTDGHPVGASLLFSVGRHDAARVAPAARNPSRSAAIWLARLVLYVGLFVGVGGSAFLALAPAASRRSGAASAPAGERAVRVALLAGIAAALASLGLFGLDALDLAFTALLRIEPWRTALFSSVGAASVCALAALGLARVALRRRAHREASRKLALGALACLGLALAATGHASAASPQWLARPGVWLHAVSAVLWIGALLPLAHALRTQAFDPAPLAFFSRLVPVVLAVLLVTGVMLAVVQLSRPGDLWTTPYGCVLFVKLLLVAALLGLGAFNRFRLTGALLAGRRAARVRMRQMIVVEAGIALLVLGVVALWRFTPPPRSHATMPPVVAVRADLSSTAANAQVDFTPDAATGSWSAQVRLLDATRAPLAAQEVTLALANVEAGVEPIEQHAVHVADASWQVPGLYLPLAGVWTIELDVLVSDFERIRLRGEASLEQVPFTPAGDSP